MLGGLGATVDPIALADQGQRLSGRVPIRNMARFTAQLLDDAGDVEVDLAFERSKGAGLRRMHGRVAAHVHLTCQRCLEPMMLEIVARPDTILLRADESDGGLPPEADVLTVPPGPMPVAQLIEEELLLALPMVPMHALAECPAQRYIAPAKIENTQRPLAELTRGRRKHE